MKTIITEKELIHCRKCGGLHFSFWHNQLEKPFVFSCSCDNPSVYGKTMDEAIKAWNAKQAPRPSNCPVCLSVYIEATPSGDTSITCNCRNAVSFFNDAWKAIDKWNEYVKDLTAALAKLKSSQP